MMRAVRAQARGVLDTLREGHVTARAAAVADSRSLVRSLFLASAVQVDLLEYLRRPRSFEEIAARLGVTRTDRLGAWLAVGVELNELQGRNGRFQVAGRRAKALAGGDLLLAAHYRSMLDYQAGPYDDLHDLLRGAPQEGRPDLARHSEVIAQVSLAAAPFAVPFLQELVVQRRPQQILDIGCGTGVYLQALLEAEDGVEGDAIDLSADVIDLCRGRLDRAGLGGRARLHVGDVRDWAKQCADRYGLITLLNNIYYFDSDERVELYRLVGTLLTDDGELALTTMTTPGSAASAHLHFMLVSQAGPAALPEYGTVERDLRRAGFKMVETRKLVPSEPFVGIRARR